MGRAQTLQYVCNVGNITSWQRNKIHEIYQLSRTQCDAASDPVLLLGSNTENFPFLINL